MWKLILAVSLLSVLVPVNAAHKGQSQPAAVVPLAFKFEPAFQRLDQKVAKIVGEDKQKTLRQMAEASVLSDYCAAVNLDQDKFKKAFDALSAGGAKRKPAEQRQFENQLMTYFGVYVGLLVAEGTERRPEFCALAQQLQKDQKPLSRFWLPATATAAIAPAQP